MSDHIRVCIDIEQTAVSNLLSARLLNIPFVKILDVKDWNSHRHLSSLDIFICDLLKRIPDSCYGILIADSSNPIRLPFPWITQWSLQTIENRDAFYSLPELKIIYSLHQIKSNGSRLNQLRHRFGYLRPGKPEIIAIGASAGGPDALRKILSGLPYFFKIPILIVQHLPADFGIGLAESLNRACPLKVQDASDDEPIRSGHVYLAPRNFHMVLDGRRRIRLLQTEPVHHCRPAIDVLFESLARIIPKGRVMAFILTGMGKDGLEGCRKLSLQGHSCYTQNRESSTVYGMPRAVKEAGFSLEELSLEDISQLITRSVYDQGDFLA
jgi:hypothetical protein